MEKFEALRIVFMGTPEFAVAALDKLVQAGCSIVGVVTAPDKAAGRGIQLQQSAVKQYAIEHGLFILQPEKLKSPDFLEQLKNLHADLQIVVAFRMLPELVWNMPPMGTVNLHGSLLPQYRGAAPINWAGTVLSQPPINTTASMGWARNNSSVSIDMRLRRNMLLGCEKLSWIEIVGKSIGKPPASMTPRLTASINCGALP